MSTSVEIRRLATDDANLWAALRWEALESHPLAFGASVPEDAATLAQSLRSRMSDESVVLGAFRHDFLVGIVGIVRNAGLKERHKSTIWGMYVTARNRQHGVGERLLRAAIEHARTWKGVQQVHLSVSDEADTAKKLYEKVGFKEWGREPRALCWEGRYADESHMIFNLDKMGADQ